MKPAPMPVIDLFAKFQVIDDSVSPPKWKTIGTGVASKATAIACAAKNGLRGVWINDGFDRRYVTA